MLIMESIILPNVSFIGRHGFLLIFFGLLNTSPLGLFILLLLVNIILSTLSHFKANVIVHDKCSHALHKSHSTQVMSTLLS